MMYPNHREVHNSGFYSCKSNPKTINPLIWITNGDTILQTDAIVEIQLY